MRLKLTTAYDGGSFRGWARQPGERTVEGELRRALGELYRSVDELAVAGRTDTGVHALANVVSVEVDGGPPSTSTERTFASAWTPESVRPATARASTCSKSESRAVCSSASTVRSPGWRAKPRNPVPSYPTVSFSRTSGAPDCTCKVFLTL